MRAHRLDDAPGRYIESAKQSFPKGMMLDGLKVVLDCANGAAYRVAPTVLWELGAEVETLGVAPDGFNINLDCGSTAPEAMWSPLVEWMSNSCSGGTYADVDTISKRRLQIGHEGSAWLCAVQVSMQIVWKLC